jgi:hypothetical protein
MSQDNIKPRPLGSARGIVIGILGGLVTWAIIALVWWSAFCQGRFN